MFIDHQSRSSFHHATPTTLQVTIVVIEAINPNHHHVR
jgi:hypothetical protein